MFKPMIAQLGWDRASISLAFFLNMAVFALTLTIAGRFYDRYGPKWVIFISTIFMAAGYICISFTDSLWEFYLYYGIIAAIGVGGALAAEAGDLSVDPAAVEEQPGHLHCALIDRLALGEQLQPHHL